MESSNNSHSWVDEQAFKRAGSSSTLVTISHDAQKVNKRFLKQANSNKSFSWQTELVRKIALSKTARLYFENIIDST